MRAAVCRSFSTPLRVEEVSLRAPRANEVGVRVAACGVCHSDVAYLRGVWGGPLPAVYGHEAAGVVEAVGEGVDGLRPGDHVVLTLIRFCGRCRMCLRGLPALCEAPPEVEPVLEAPGGEVVAQGVRTAAFAERVTVHASQAIGIPPDVPLESAALIGCGVLTGVGAVLRSGGVEACASVGVIGTGGVGLNALQGAVLAGAARIVAIDLVDAKLEAALEFGATETVNAARDQVTGLLDCVVVTAGSAVAVEQALKLVGTAGTVVLVGMPGGATATIDPEAVADRGLRIVGSKVGSARPQLDVPALIELYRRGRLELDRLVSHRFALDEVNDAIAVAERGEALRAVVLP